jgi:hypothetical protein
VILAGVAAVITLTACGSGARQDANEPSGTFHVDVSSAFPAKQRLAEASHLVITVRNVDAKKTIPDVAVTICNVTCTPAGKATQAGGEGTSVQAFADKLTYPAGQLASDSRPVWIVDRPPNPHGCQYSCQQGGPGGAVTAYANTWALGSLKPGATKTFDWKVTAVKAGSYTVAWQVAAGLNGKAKARTTTGTLPQGKFAVKIAGTPQQAYVNDAGGIVKTP